MIGSFCNNWPGLSEIINIFVKQFIAMFDKDDVVAKFSMNELQQNVMSIANDNEMSASALLIYGKTTKQQFLEMFGNPTRMTITDNNRSESLNINLTSTLCGFLFYSTSEFYVQRPIYFW